MKKLLIATACALILATPAYAQSVATTGLTAEQVAKVEADIANAKLETVSSKTPGPTKMAQQVNEWVQIGQGVGSGLASAAKELGMVANDFAKTPVGQLTVAVIVWKVIGQDMKSLFLGLLWFLTMVPLWAFYYGKFWKTGTTVEYHENGKRKLVTTLPIQNTDTLMGSRLIGLVPFALLVIIGLCIL